MSTPDASSALPLDTPSKSLLAAAPPQILQHIAKLEEQISRLTDIGLAISREKNMPRLMEMILEEAKRITNADGRTLYMMTEDQRLKFEIIRTDSLNFHMGGTSGKEIPFYPVKLYLEDGTANHKMVAAHVALSGEVVNIPDAYVAEGYDFTGTRAFDAKTGYRSQSFLTVPLRNHLDEIIGVIQLLNARDPSSAEVVPFSRESQGLVESLCSQAAVAITNKQLIKQLEDLFDAFIQVIAAAIDEKSPYTGGHCQRIPIITRMIAEAVNRTTEGPYAHVKFSEDEMRELMISAWLHDTGKVATPIHVVDKSNKLETLYDRIHDVATRFEVLKRDEEIAYLKQRRELERGRRRKALAELDERFQARLAQLEEDRKFLETVNIGGEFLSKEKKERVLAIAAYTWILQGGVRPFLSPEDVYNLCIERGTLTPEERKIINNHTVVTIRMLTKLPWPKRLKRVPEFAGAHHEKLDGTGYPQGLNASEIPLQPRIVAIADIFEALTARDRPYKKGKTLSETVAIMKKMRDDYHIDPDLFDIFLTKKVFREYGEKYLPAEQIDDVVA